MSEPFVKKRIKVFDYGSAGIKIEIHHHQYCEAEFLDPNEAEEFGVWLAKANCQTGMIVPDGMIKVMKDLLARNLRDGFMSVNERRVMRKSLNSLKKVKELVSDSGRANSVEMRALNRS